MRFFAFLTYRYGHAISGGIWMKKNTGWKKVGAGLALSLMPLVGWAGEGQIFKLDLKSGKDSAVLTISHSGNGKFRLFKSEKQGSVIVEAENLNIPPALTKMQDASASGGPVMQVTPYNSQHGGHPMAKLVLQLRNKADVTSSDQPGKFLIEIKKQPWASSANSKPAKASVTDEFKSRLSAVQKSEEVAKKLVDVLSQPYEDKKYFGSQVSFEGKDVDVPDIFRLVGESSDLNIMWDQDVEGQKTSLDIKDLPWDQLLDIVIQQKGLKAAVMGNVVRIMTIDSYNKQMEARNKELALSDDLEPVIMAVVPLSFTSATDMKTLITDLLQDKPAAASGLIKLDQAFKRGKIEVDSRTNSLVVTNTKDSVERIRRLVKELDIAVPQVLIDAKIVIASETFSKAIGIRWQEHIPSESGNAGSAGVFSAGGTESLGGGASAADASSTFAISAAKGVGVIGFGFGASDRANIKAALELAEINELTKTVAAPRVMVINNKKADISDGTTITQLVPGGGNQDAGKSVTSGKLSLSVTPQVTSHGSVQMKELTITKNSIEGSTSTTANTSEKGLKTDVLVDSGGTLVLGGIFQMTSTLANSGIPLLKDLPFIGQLFRVNSESNKKDELMVFITPQIIDPESTSQSL
jgi:type IV pilus assembly protein PilQ